MVTVREASLDDVENLHKIGEGVHEFSVNDGTIAFWPKDTLAEAISSDDVIILVAEEQSSIVGFVIATYVSGLRKSTIENIFVTPERREAGIGDALLKNLLDVLASHGCQYVATLVPQNAAAAAGLYKRAGFARGETFVWLDKPLSGSFKRLSAS
jgi:ribosomal protein S18 acetylase RimI-like enzyme